MTRANLHGRRRTLVYILAPSYSGSTLLTFLLAQHQDIATVGELKAGASRGDLRKYYCSCGTLQCDCKFWQKVTARMQESHSRFALDDFGTHLTLESRAGDKIVSSRVRGPLFEGIRNMLLCWPSFRGRLKEILGRNRQIIEIICDLQSGKYFLDGSKDPARLRFLQSTSCWEIKVIYLTRDGRGVTNSSMRHYDVSMETAALDWVHTHQECDRLVHRIGGRSTTRIRYEDLVASPEATLAEIYSFLELEGSGLNRRYWEGEQHIMGNQMRIAPKKEIALDESWRTVLTQDDLSIFHRIAGKTNRAYGYGSK